MTTIPPRKDEGYREDSSPMGLRMTKTRDAKHALRRSLRIDAEKRAIHE